MDSKCFLTSTDLQTRRARCQHQLSFLFAFAQHSPRPPSWWGGGCCPSPRTPSPLSSFRPSVWPSNEISRARPWCSQSAFHYGTATRKF